MNKHRGEVKMQVKNRTYTLKFTINAIAELEDILDCTVEKIVIDVGIKKLRAIIWAGLLEEHPEVTLKMAGEILEEVGTEYGMDCISEAFTAAMPKIEGADTVKKNPVVAETETAGTGTNSLETPSKQESE